jgi:ribosome-associated toxin RatA of RatAB toxin-antitoxin module
MNLKNNHKQVLLILVFISVAFDVHCQNWNLNVDKEGVKVYTRTIAGSDVQEFRGEITVKANLSSVLTAIDSVSEYPKWMYKCSYAERVKKVNQSSGYIYSVIDSPWPVSDRDLCTFYTVKQDTLTKIITITMIGKKDYIPEKSEKVRVPAMKGFWQFIPTAKGVTKIVYQVHCESGGIVPAAIVNAYITDTPFYNLLNLKKIVESPLFPKIVMKNVKEL